MNPCASLAGSLRAGHGDEGSAARDRRSSCGSFAPLSRAKRVTKIVILSESKDRVINSPAAPPNGAPLSRAKRVTKIVILSESKDRVTNSPAAPPNGAPLRMTFPREDQEDTRGTSSVVLHCTLSEHSN